MPRINTLNRTKYADILRQDQTPCSTLEHVSETRVDDGHVTVATPHATDPDRSSYGSWEYTYFAHLIEMRNIFARDVLRMFPDSEETFLYVYSPRFLHRFARMIYGSSSGHISGDVELLSEDMMNVYSEYMIKRDGR